MTRLSRQHETARIKRAASERGWGRWRRLVRSVLLTRIQFDSLTLPGENKSQWFLGRSSIVAESTKTRNGQNFTGHERTFVESAADLDCEDLSSSYSQNFASFEKEFSLPY
jgi:hypothetical protein